MYVFGHTKEKVLQTRKKTIYPYKELYRSQYTEDTSSAKRLHEDRTYLSNISRVIRASSSNRSARGLVASSSSLRNGCMVVIGRRTGIIPIFSVLLSLQPHVQTHLLAILPLQT